MLPRLNSIDGELKSINKSIDSVNTRIDEMDKRNSIRFDATRNEITGMDKRLTTEVRSLSEKVDLVRDAERLKIEVAELKRRR